MLCEVLGWSSSEPKAMGLRPAVSKSVAVFSPPSGLDLGFRIWVLPNNGLQQTRSTRFFPWGIRAASLRPVALAAEPGVGQTGEANQECRPRRLKKSGSRRRRDALHGSAFTLASGLGRRLAPCEAPQCTDKSAVLFEACWDGRQMSQKPSSASALFQGASLLVALQAEWT